MSCRSAEIAPVRYLYLTGLAFDGAGALLIAWPVIRPGREAVEEGRPRWGGNPWVVVIRLKEQRYVQVGAMFLLLGFALQFGGYLTASWTDLVLIPAVVAFLAIGVAVGRRVAEGGLPHYAERTTTAEIHDQRHVFGITSPDGMRKLAQLSLMAKSGRILMDLDTEALARINHGRWVASCPQCGNDTIGWPTHARAFCLDDGVSFPVRFPDDEKRATITRLLLRRPMENRNWSPEESIEELQNENRMHGFAAD